MKILDYICSSLVKTKKCVYVILERPDVFVILGAYKSNQDLDIKKIDKLFNGFKM